MTSLPYSYSSTPIMEAWLIKGLRLALSKKPVDQERLRKMYKEACENEAQVSRITLAEALREPRDGTAQVEITERESHSPSGQTSRIRPAHIIGEQSLSIGMNPLSSATDGGMSSSDSSSSSSNVSSSINMAKGSKRNKLALFNMFDPTAAVGTKSASGSSAAQRPLTPRSSVPVVAVPGVIDLTEPSTEHPGERTKSIQNDVSATTTAVPCTASATTGASSLNTILTNPTTIDLAMSTSHESASVVSVSHLESTTSSTSSNGAGRVGDAQNADARLLASLVADLACRMCGKLTRQPQLEPDGVTINSNVLVECVKCGALYHQMCHQPPVLSSSNVNPREWKCDSCSPAVVDLTSTVGSTHSTTSVSAAFAASPAQTLPNTTDTSKPRTSATPLLVSSSSVPTAGARKRKAGLTSAFVTARKL